VNPGGFTVLSVSNAENIKILADGIKEYFSQYELEDLCRRLDITIEYSGTSPNMRRLAGDVLAAPYAEPHRGFLTSVLSDLIKRCHDQVQNATREDNLYHQQMSLQLGQLRDSLKQNKRADPLPPKETQSQIVSARSRLVDFFGQAQTVVTITDAAPGVGTQDCLIKVDHPIRMLISEPSGGFDRNFSRALSFLRDRGKTVEMRLSKNIHDCTVIFNQRCWLFPCPLKEAIESRPKMIEIIDGRDAMSDLVESNWRRAEMLIIA
jgi:hypothetical protein